MNIAIFTNILNPYRMSLFDEMYNYAINNGHNLRVYAMTGEKSDRPWKYEEFETEYTKLLNSNTVKLRIKNDIFLHFNPGLKNEIVKYRPDIVVMAGSYLQPTVIRLTQLQKKYGYMTFFWSESHFDEARGYNTFLLKLRECIRTKILRKMDGFWYPGEKAKEFVNRYKNDHAVLIQVPNTVEDNFFNVTECNESKKNNSPKIIFTPARLYPVKGILEFMDIIKNIPASSYVWKIAGDGELKNEIINKAKNNNVNLELLGNLLPKDVKRYYSLADIFLLPSKSDPNPLTCVEALWSRLPLFVSEHVGNGPEVVNPGKNGYVFSYDAPDIAVRMLNEIINADNHWYKEASEVSHQIAEDCFRQSLVAKKAIDSVVSARNDWSI